jgi:Glycosyltransferase 61
MLSLRPTTYRLRRALRLDRKGIAAAAIERWVIAPAELMEVPPAIYVPGQIERIARTEFAPLDHTIRSLAGDPAEPVDATVAYRLRDVHIVDGVLYSRGLSLHLRARKHRLPLPRRTKNINSGSLYETWVGNRWFGNWLGDDCLSYRLTEETGAPPVTTSVSCGHVPRYEELLAMRPRRIGDTHFDELIVIDDHANNNHRKARAQDMRRRLLRGRNTLPTPGVLLVRGRHGSARVLENEEQIASRLESEYGFRVMQPEDHSVDELIEACGEARIVAGVEGSQLAHGLAVMPAGGTLLTLQPPDRATTALKLLTDRWQQRFAIVIGQGAAESFSVDWGDVARTLDRIEAVTAL